MPTVRLFNSKNGQAFLLPEGIRFRGRVVKIFRRGDDVVLRDLAPRVKRRKGAKRLSGIPPVGAPDLSGRSVVPIYRRRCR